MAGFESELQNGKKDFYKRNIGKAINLFGDNLTLSGDLFSFDESKGNVVLTNYIDRKYNPNGTSLFWENPGEFNISVLKPWSKAVTTREDRLGRIQVIIGI